MSCIMRFRFSGSDVASVQRGRKQDSSAVLVAAIQQVSIVFIHNRSSFLTDFCFFFSELGLWSPDLWFHLNFQSDQPQPLMQRNRFSRGAVSVDSAQPSMQDPQSGFRRMTTDTAQPSAQDPVTGYRRVACLAALQPKGIPQQTTPT